MKKLIISAVAMALVAACGTKATTQVSGSVPEGEETVQIVTADIDTTLTVADGKFCIEVPTKVTAISYAVAAGRQVSFIADGSKITVDFEDGEAQSSSKNGVQARFADYQNWNDDFMAEYRESVSKEELSDDEREEITENAVEKYNEHLLQVIKANKDNVLGLIGISNIELDDDAEMLALINGLSDELLAEPRVQAMKKSLDASSKTAEGQMFTDFEVDGVKFSDFIGKGKYMLVDFWASWCGPCRGEMPNLRSVYEKYHGDKFDMLSVAVWDKPEDTVEAAKEENIVWNQIINAQRIPTDIYGIQGIPHIILFGPDGTILKRNLRGEAIGKAVAEALAD
ncbi:MAG: redoxin domain-containing protein [Bacteroidales bacterium]|nr:redoxin domain-containing protein [Bacteroidales bacterium]